MYTKYVSESFDGFIVEKNKYSNDLKSLKKGDLVNDYYGEPWEVIAIGTYEEVKQYDESDSIKDLIEAKEINSDEILVAVKTKIGETSVFLYGEDGVIKEENTNSIYDEFDVISVGNESENNSTLDIYFNVEGNEFVVVNVLENGEEKIEIIDEDEFIPSNYNLNNNIWEKVFVNEARFQIKRKYKNYTNKIVNEKTPIRNKIIRFVGNRYVTDEDFKNYLTKIEEDRGKPINQIKWFNNNKQYFKLLEKGGEKFWILSKFGMRIYHKINVR